MKCNDTSENEIDTDPRIMIAQMTQAWSDARSYVGNVLWIATICLTVIALSLNFAEYVSHSSPDF